MSAEVSLALIAGAMQTVACLVGWRIARVHRAGFGTTLVLMALTLMVLRRITAAAYLMGLEEAAIADQAYLPVVISGLLLVGLVAHRVRLDRISSVESRRREDLISATRKVHEAAGAKR